MTLLPLNCAKILRLLLIVCAGCMASANLEASTLAIGRLTVGQDAAAVGAQYKPAPKITPKFNKAARGQKAVPKPVNPKPPAKGFGNAKPSKPLKKTFNESAQSFGTSPKPKALTKKFNDKAGDGGNDDGSGGGGGGKQGGSGGDDGGGTPPTLKRGGPVFKPPGM